MARGEVGARPLLLDIIKRVISYTSNIKGRPHTIAHSAYNFETKNDLIPNFCVYLNKFNLGDQNIYDLQKSKVSSICQSQNNYDRRWCINIKDSPKAITYGMYKNTVFFEKYLYEIENRKFKIALTRFRLSNHNLLIEKGRHMRPRLERNERICFICKDAVEDEIHFITKCPLYSKERIKLYRSLQDSCAHFISLATDEQKFIYIMANEDKKILRELGKYVYNAALTRDKMIHYFFA